MCLRSCTPHVPDCGADSGGRLMSDKLLGIRLKRECPMWEVDVNPWRAALAVVAEGYRAQSGSRSEKVQPGGRCFSMAR